MTSWWPSSARPAVTRAWQKAITSRWLDPSHGGINLGFPTN
jgi:hypothetical protein